MKMVTTFSKFILTILIALSYGCASIDTASPEADAAAKQFTPDESVSQVYLYRNEVLGAAVSMPVTVDGKLAGSTGPKSYFKFGLPAGKHVFTSQGDKSTLEVETRNGEIYYIWQEVKMGVFSGGSELQLVDEETGQKGVAECKLIKSAL